LETYQPGFFSETFKRNMSAITLGSVGILFSLLALLLLVRPRVREGFQSPDFVDQAKTLVKTYKLTEICSIYTDIFDKLLALEKGPPPSTVTDAQARERAEKTFQGLMKSRLLSCKQVQELASASTVDAVFEAMATLDNTLLVQAFETALASRELIIQQYNKVQQAKNQKVEAFTVCTREQAEERRKEQDQQEKARALEKCKLPEDISQAEKDQILKTKFSVLVSNLDAHKKQFQLKESLQKILDDYNYYKNDLEKDKQAAQSGTLVKPSAE
jgi:hypothetical protein